LRGPFQARSQFFESFRQRLSVHHFHSLLRVRFHPDQPSHLRYKIYSFTALVLSHSRKESLLFNYTLNHSRFIPDKPRLIAHGVV